MPPCAPPAPGDPQRIAAAIEHLDGCTITVGIAGIVARASTSPDEVWMRSSYVPPDTSADAAMGTKYIPAQQGSGRVAFGSAARRTSPDGVVTSTVALISGEPPPVKIGSP
jgi:hypothetical protein